MSALLRKGYKARILTTSLQLYLIFFSLITVFQFHFSFFKSSFFFHVYFLAQYSSNVDWRKDNDTVNPCAPCTQLQLQQHSSLLILLHLFGFDFGFSLPLEYFKANTRFYNSSPQYTSVCAFLGDKDFSKIWSPCQN